VSDFAETEQKSRKKIQEFTFSKKRDAPLFVEKVIMHNFFVRGLSVANHQSVPDGR
jgi:hypothetical protein